MMEVIKLITKFTYRTNAMLKDWDNLLWDKTLI